MDFSAKLENLQAKVNETVATARAAAAENRDQLKQRVDQAQDEAKQAMEDAKQQAGEAADRAQSKWAQMKADAAAKREDIKAKIDKRADQLDAKAAAKDADWPSRMQPTPSTTPSGWSPTRNWPCSTRWMRVSTQTSGPRSPARRSQPKRRDPPRKGRGWSRGHRLTENDQDQPAGIIPPSYSPGATPTPRASGYWRGQHRAAHFDTLRSPSCANVPEWILRDERLVQRPRASLTMWGRLQPMTPKRSWTDPTSMSSRR
jgi:hypothetical protein